MLPTSPITPNPNPSVSITPATIKTSGKISKKYKKVAYDLSNYLNSKYLILKDIATKAKKNAEGAHKRQADKTNDALEKVSLAQNTDFPLPAKEIGAIRQREYTKAIIEQVNAEHADILAIKVESLAIHLSKAAKKAQKVAESVDHNTDINSSQ